MQVDETEDGATLHGGVRLGSGTIESHGDHRIAMAFAIAGQISNGEVRINDIATSPRPSRTSTAWRAAPASTCLTGGSGFR